MNREELINNFIEHVDRGFRETGTYDFYFVNMVDDGEDLTVCMTGNGPRSEKHAKEISLVPDAIREIEKGRSEIERLLGIIREMAESQIETVEKARDIFTIAEQATP
jgi:hypothetical protein